ncbi:MAG: 4-hydroxy-tetrahydrodipicolinate reductase [Elusimicrobia bacterium]|nr:4-hydroxy-tetrahydrodipicolinate reductase [Elusimicrobiota bacterium]
MTRRGRPRAGKLPDLTPLRIVVCGAWGRMGNRILTLASQDSKFQVVGALEAPGHPKCGEEVLPGVRVTDQLKPLLDQHPHVVIDFTTPAATLEHALETVRTKRAMVIGTTGFSQAERSILARRVAPLPVVIASNMSLAVNVLFHMAGMVGRILNRYDIHIHEIHHRQKKDAPSGTALTLQKLVSQASGRQPDEVHVTSDRSGDVVGDHIVQFTGTGERLILTHQAQSRDPFAIGALQAAQWVVRQRPGLYDMRDVLGLSED